MALKKIISSTCQPSEISDKIRCIENEHIISVNNNKILTNKIKTKYKELEELEKAYQNSVKVN